MIDKRKTIKSSFKKVIINNHEYINTVVKQANKLMFTCSYFIRHYLLYLYKNEKEIPILNKDFIMTCFRVISKSESKKGPKQKKNMELKNNLNKFFKNSFLHIIYPNTRLDKDDIDKHKFSSANLSYILQEASEEMRISYENNIRLNFFKYICQYVNQNFKEEHNKQIEKCTKNKKKLRKILKKELMDVKKDLIKCTLNSDKKYHNWINEHKKKILPEKFKGSYETDIKHYPFKYLKYMLNMNSHLEKYNYKMFQPIPLRTDIKDKYITINTNALIDILPLSNKGDHFKHIHERQYELWSIILDPNKYKRKNYIFNNQISTDGTSVSVNLIHVDEVEKKNKKRLLLKKASINGKNNNKNKSRQEIEKEINDKKENNINKKIEKTNILKKKYKKEKEEFKNLPKDEQLRIKIKKRMETQEFNYISDIIKCDSYLKELKKARKNKNIVYGDPGKRSPLFLLGENGKKIEYRTRNRLSETKRIKYIKLIDNLKKKTISNFKKNKNWSLKNVCNLLTNYNRKTLDMKQFMNYSKIKFRLRNFIINEEKYNNYLKKLKWFSYINKQKHEDNLINKLKNTYGKNAIFVLGDWCNKGKLSFISTPNLGIKRKLKEHFKVYHIDEFKTSKMHHKYKIECNNLKLHINGKLRKLHSIVTFKMSNGRIGCINRDYNSVLNMKKIMKSLLKKNKRPSYLSRTKSN